MLQGRHHVASTDDHAVWTVGFAVRAPTDGHLEVAHYENGHQWRAPEIRSVSARSAPGAKERVVQGGAHSNARRRAPGPLTPASAPKAPGHLARRRREEARGCATAYPACHGAPLVLTGCRSLGRISILRAACITRSSARRLWTRRQFSAIRRRPASGAHRSSTRPASRPSRKPRTSTAIRHSTFTPFT